MNENFSIVKSFVYNNNIEKDKKKVHRVISSAIQTTHDTHFILRTAIKTYLDLEPNKSAYFNIDMRWNIQNKQHGLDNKFIFYGFKDNSIDEVIGSSFSSVIQISDGTMHFIVYQYRLLSSHRVNALLLLGRAMAKKSPVASGSAPFAAWEATMHHVIMFKMII